ncbi:hypothetical protein BaRGS_00005150 [Batillaria attramentaria]|uniref:F5/8 type C domain-containing protein n=1 Tax=Batillaria attramentaria TaxID=370345 RepID=A0ABD0LWW5_9CAEN
MGKEAELLKAVKSKDIKKIQKFLTSSSMKKKGMEECTWQSVEDTGHQIRKHLTHIDINVKEADTGYTPLLLAVLGGSRDIAEMLIFHSADVAVTDAKGNSALHLAVFSSRPDLVVLLLTYGADVNSLNGDQNTPLHIACQNNIKVPILLKLIQSGANVWLKNKDDHTPLDTAAMYNKKEAVSVLMDSCPTLTSNQCAIVEAAMRDNAEVLELLLEYGIDPNELDTLRGSTALHEAVRFSRLKSAEVLLAFGADADKQNLKKETPTSLAKELPAQLQAQFDSLFKAYSGRQSRIPKYLAQRESTLTDSFKVKCLKDYPVLPCQKTWTQNTKEYCSSCTEANPNLHVVDDNPTTFWVIPEMHDAWTTLDLGSVHIITGITILGWDSPQMVHSFELQAADTLQGPWSTFTAHCCKRVGSANPKDPGVEQTFKGFTVKARYIKLYIVDNHGGNSICFQGLRLHGVDCRILDLLHCCMLRHLGDSFIANGINTYLKFLDLTEEEIATIVDDPMDVSVLYQMIQEDRRQASSQVGVREEVQVVAEGADIEGTCRVHLSPLGEGVASTAVFHGLKLKTVGQFVLRVKGVTTDITLEAPEEIEVRPAKKSSNEISAAFDEIQSMLSSIQDSF